MKTFQIFWIVILLYDKLIDCTSILSERCALHDDTLLRFKRQQIQQPVSGPQAIRGGPVGGPGKVAGQPMFYDDNSDTNLKNIPYSSGGANGQMGFGGNQGLGNSASGNMNPLTNRGVSGMNGMSGSGRVMLF
uniref:Uncharacterized protein n=1 Tax=Strongyloides venezuelensis TaxID=75913 RepID=A0A0K0F3N7_STRVS